MGTELGFGFTERAREDVTTETLNLEAGSLSATRIFTGPWANRFSFIQKKLTTSYPPFPQAIVSTINITGEGSADTQEDVTLNYMPKWDRALITVNYNTITVSSSSNRAGQQFGTPEFTQKENKDQRYIEEQIDAAPEFLNVDGKDLLDDAGAALHDEGRFHLLVVHLNISLRIPNVTHPNWDAIQARIGDVNDNGFVTPSGFPAQAGALRYDGPTGITKVNPVVGLQGSSPLPSWDMTHQFSFNRRGWNNRWVDNRWQAITDANGNPLFRAGNLYSIFFGLNADAFNTGTLLAISDDQETINNMLDDPAFREDGADFIAVSKRLNERIRSLGFRIPAKK